jgi:hypothetical protein
MVPTPTNADCHFVLPTVGEENESAHNYSFAYLAPKTQNETTLQSNVSQLHKIERLADLRRQYGHSTGLDQTI